MRVLLTAMTMLAGLIAHSAAMADSPPPPRHPEPKMFCTEQYQPVCGTKEGKRTTYSNRCFADVDHATDISDGECAAAK
jgi:hypothetical protein